VADATQRSLPCACEQVSETLSVVRNSAPTEEGRGLLEQLQSYVQTHDVLVSLPGDSQLTLSSRNINEGELNLSLKFDQEDSSDNATEGKQVTEHVLKLWVAIPERASV
jgi:hypothetical protein